MIEEKKLAVRKAKLIPSEPILHEGLNRSTGLM